MGNSIKTEARAREYRGRVWVDRSKEAGARAGEGSRAVRQTSGAVLMIVRAGSGWRRVHKVDLGTGERAEYDWTGLHAGGDNDVIKR